jgi:hypothetical protein
METSNLPKRKSFSSQLPLLQTAWDSTSLSTYKTCPRKYQYAIIEGWQTRQQSVHLWFGIAYHAALELYDHLTFDGASHDDAVERVVDRLATEHGGNYRDEGGPQDNSGGPNPDEPGSRQWDWHYPEPTNTANLKNPRTLIRTVVWYLDRFKQDPLVTVRLANGEPAVELSFRVEVGEALTGEPVLYCGHLDRLATLGDQLWVVDRKTSKSPPDFRKYNPDNQMSGYTFGAKVGYHTPVQGVIIDAAQIAVGFSRFERGITLRTDDQLEEWLNDSLLFIARAQYDAEKEHWPINDLACSMYGGCPFREVCAATPEIRPAILETHFVRKFWDPLQVRGDI